MEGVSGSGVVNAGGIAATVVGTGFGAAWIRERRRGRKDANDFALALINAQAARIDALVVELGMVRGEMVALKEENARLKAMAGFEIVAEPGGTDPHTG